jgi:hypothetical protein
VAGVIASVRRGEEPDELYLVTSDGKAILLHAHGVHPEERMRVREAALKLLGEALAR